MFFGIFQRRSYQIIQEEPLRVVIKIVPKSDFSEKDGTNHASFSTHLGEKDERNHRVSRRYCCPPSGKSVFVINRCLAICLAIERVARTNSMRLR